MSLTRSPPRQRKVREDTFADYTPKARAVVPGRGWVAVIPEAEPQARPSTAAERAHMGRVAALGCVVCRLMGLGPTPAQVHHVRAGVGKAQRAGNFCTVPLCEPHHTGPRGVHGDKGCLRQLRMSELDLLDLVIGELAT